MFKIHTCYESINENVISFQNGSFFSFVLLETVRSKKSFSCVLSPQTPEHQVVRDERVSLVEGGAGCEKGSGGGGGEESGGNGESLVDI